MFPETITEIQRDDLAQIVFSVFQTMVGVDVAECEITPFSAQTTSGSTASPHPGVTATVHFSGDWQGALTIGCDLPQARAFAHHYLAPAGNTSALSPPSDDVACDVLGELTNMVGGNVKCVLNRGLALSMPQVLQNTSPPDRPPAALPGFEIRHQLAFQSGNGVFTVTLYSPRA